jgi:hypothetical protein
MALVGLTCYQSNSWVSEKEAIMARIKRRTPWFLWPFTALWNLIAYFVSLTGRLLAIILGLVLMTAGLIVTLTVVGAIIGIPLFTIGALLVVRGLW